MALHQAEADRLKLAALSSWRLWAARRRAERGRKQAALAAAEAQSRLRAELDELRQSDCQAVSRAQEGVRRKADAVRCAILERMREAGVSDGNQGQPEEARHHDWMATKRGACGDCNECAGFVPPLFPGGQDNMMNNALIQYCFGCGCTATAHAQVDRKA